MRSALAMWPGYLRTQLGNGSQVFAGSVAREMRRRTVSARCAPLDEAHAEAVVVAPVRVRRLPLLPPLLSTKVTLVLLLVPRPRFGRRRVRPRSVAATRPAARDASAASPFERAKRCAAAQTRAKRRLHGSVCQQRAGPATNCWTIAFCSRWQTAGYPETERGEHEATSTTYQGEMTMAMMGLGAARPAGQVTAARTAFAVAHARRTSARRSCALGMGPCRRRDVVSARAAVDEVEAKVDDEIEKCEWSASTFACGVNRARRSSASPHRFS